LTSCTHHITCLRFSVYHVRDRFDDSAFNHRSIQVLMDLTDRRMKVRSHEWAHRSCDEDEQIDLLAIYHIQYEQFKLRGSESLKRIPHEFCVDPGLQRP
jgi:hypothetical protein